MKLPVRSLLKTTLSLIIIICFTAGLVLTAAASQSRDSYIVQGIDSDRVVEIVEDLGGRVTSRLAIIQGVAADLPESAVHALRSSPAILTVTLNGPIQAVGAQTGTLAGSALKEKSWPATDYPDAVGADYTWEQGVVGDGVTVAVVDSGIRYHPAFFKDQKGNFASRLVGWVDLVSGSKHPIDPNGHGTHVAGVIGNTHIGADGEWNGVAPAANLAVVRVLDKYGYGTYETVLGGLQWVVDNREAYNIQVLNLSLVAPVQSPYWADPLNVAVMHAWASGIVVVTAAGNGGPGPFSIGVPGNNPYAVTVGAFTDSYTPYEWGDDYLAPFSAAGPTLDGFVKPDLVAPGGHIVSTMAMDAYLAHQHQANKVDNFYFSMAGTSQSAAVVSGVVALVRSMHPDLSPDEVKYRLLVSAFPWVELETTDALYSMWQQGAGRVNAPDAVFGDLTGTANLGLNIAADLAGEAHFQGYTIYNEETGEFGLLGGYGNWSGGYGNWSGGYGNWSGGYGNWSGGFGNWSGGYGNWSGGYGNWSGGYGNWSGGFGNWSGGYGNWSGGFGNWSGGYGNWSGGYGNWSGGFEGWLESFGNWSGSIGIPSTEGLGDPDNLNWTSSITMPEWVDEGP